MSLQLNRVLFAMISIVLFFTVCTRISADTETLFQKEPATLLEKEAEALYLAASDSNRQSAFYHIQQFQRLLAAPEITGKANPEGIADIRRNVLILQADLDAGKPAAEWEGRIYGLKLAVDALLHDDNALWLGYQKVLQEDLAALKSAWITDTAAGFGESEMALNRFKDHAALVEGAALMHRNPQQVMLLNERIKYTGTLLAASRAGKTEREWLEASLIPLDNAARSLFQGDSKPVDEPLIVPVAGAPSWQWPAILGALILVVLGFSGWRRYRLDEEEVSVPKR